MRKLYFTNARGQTVEFSATSKYKLQNVDDIGGLEAVSQSVSSPYQDGSTPVGDSFFESKVISVEFVVVSETLDADIRNLNNILNPKIGVGKLAIESDDETYVLEKVKTRMLPTRPREKNQGKYFQISEIIFEIFDPLYSDVDFTTTILATTLPLLEFPIDIEDGMEFSTLDASAVTIVNEGDVEAPIQVSFKGPLTAPIVLTKAETGEKITLSLNVATDEQIEITTDDANLNVILRDLTDGSAISAFGYIDVANTDFFKLDVGNNTLELTAAANFSQVAIVKHKQKYVGV